MGSTFQVAFREFCKAFRGTTRIHWDERLSHQNGCGVGTNAKGDWEGDARVHPYTYIPPEEGQSRGLIPAVELIRERYEENRLEL